MAASILIIIFSVSLLVYWLRNACLLLLKEIKADAHHCYPLFSFPGIRAELRAGNCATKLQPALARDYTVLRYLIRSAPVGRQARLLLWNYQIMRCWYEISSVAFPTQARIALEEMVDVVAALACTLKNATARAR